MQMCSKLVAIAVAACAFVCSPIRAHAQVAVTTYYPATPVVSYVPEFRGLFGRRVAYRPVVSYLPAAIPSYAAPVVAEAAPVVTQYAPPPVTTYYTPAPRIAYLPPIPVRTYYAPPPVTTYYFPGM